MRKMRLFACLAALLVAAERPAHASEDAKRTASESTSNTDDAPPPIKTNLDETASAAPQSNPWVDGGLAKRRGPKDSGAADEDAKPVSVAVLGGYATEKFRLGFGLRAGYSIFDRLYVGAAFVYHLGYSIGEASVAMFYPSAELGFDAHIGPVTIRPYGGAGLLVVHASRGSAGASQEYFGVYPGLQIDLAIPGTSAFVGADGRALILPGEKQFDPSIGVFFIAGSRL